MGFSFSVWFFWAAIMTARPQDIIKAAVKHEVAVILHYEPWVVVFATSIWCPAWIFVVLMGERVIQN